MVRRAFAVIVAAVVVAFVAGACSGGSPSASRDQRAHEAVTSSSTTATTSPSSVAPITSPDQLTAPQSAPDTTAVLIRVERALRADDTYRAGRVALGWQQQLAYGALASHPEWVEAVLAALPDDVRSVVVANHDAAVKLTAPDLGAVPTSLPDWTIRTPPAPSVLLGYYHEAEAASSIPWTYLAAIHFVETRMGRIHGNSTAGAQGPMQFIPSTWAEYGNGGDVNDDHDAILAAGRFLAANGGATDIDHALFAYNPSTNYVAAIEDYAGVLQFDPGEYDGYYAWQVYVTTTAGTMRLPEGWTRP